MEREKLSMRKNKKEESTDLGLIWCREEVKEELRAPPQASGLAQCGGEVLQLGENAGEEQVEQGQ